MLLNILWVLGVGGLVVADRIPPYASVQTDNDHPLLVRRGGSTLLSRSGSSSSIGIDAPLKHNIPSSNTSSTHSPSRNSRLPRNDYENFDYYAVQLDDNNGAVSGEQLDEHAAALAYAHGLNLLGRIGNMNSYYYFSTEKKWRRLRQGDDDLTLRIQSSSSSSTPLVAWVSRQLPRKLTRRAMITEQLSGCTASSLPTSRLDPRGPPLRVNQTKLGIFDPEFKNQWHLVRFLDCVKTVLCLFHTHPYHIIV